MCLILPIHDCSWPTDIIQAWQETAELVEKQLRWKRLAARQSPASSENTMSRVTSATCGDARRHHFFAQTNKNTSRLDWYNGFFKKTSYRHFLQMTDKSWAASKLSWWKKNIQWARELANTLDFRALFHIPCQSISPSCSESNQVVLVVIELRYKACFFHAVVQNNQWLETSNTAPEPSQGCKPPLKSLDRWSHNLEFGCEKMSTKSKIVSVNYWRVLWWGEKTF